MSKEGRLSVSIRNMVDMETEEFIDGAKDVKDKIDAAISLATGVEDLTELYDSVKDVKFDTTAGYINVSMLDPLGAREIIKKGHLNAIRDASSDNSIATIERKIGLTLSRQKDMLAALSTIESTNSNSLF